MRFEHTHLRRPAHIRNASTRQHRGVVLIALMFFAGVVVALGGCATAGVAAPSVVELTQAHYAPTQTVDVLSAPPQAAFERIARLQLSDPTGVATQSQLVAQLADSAKTLGADALVIEQVSRAGGTDVTFNPAGGQMQNTGNGGALAITALAIRYTH
jgi:hypothetical protein